MKLVLALIFIGLSVLINLYGLVALVLALLGYPKELVLFYLGLAVLTIPIFLIVRLLSPISTWRKTAIERSSGEQAFIRLYDANFLLVAIVWAIIIVAAIRHG